MSKLNLSPADSIKVFQYLEKVIGLRGSGELNRLLGPLKGDIPILISHLIPFESLYPGIVGSVVVFIIGLLTNKDPIIEKLNDPSFVESERNRFRNSVLGKEEQPPNVKDLSKELIELLKLQIGATQ